jgi:preprotein translocase SecE subunit
VAPSSGAAQATSPEEHLHDDVPSELRHASADIDEFDAALVRGAGGVAVPDADNGDEREADEADAGDALQARDEITPPGGSGGGRGGAGAGDGTTPSGAPLRGGNRVGGFIRASWAELQRVQWPDRRQVTQATAVVLGFVAIAGAYLGLADFVAKEIVEFIL